MWPHNTDLDHIIPTIHGGFHGPVRWMCRSCNRSKGAALGNALRATRKTFVRPRW